MTNLLYVVLSNTNGELLGVFNNSKFALKAILSNLVFSKDDILATKNAFNKIDKILAKLDYSQTDLNKQLSIFVEKEISVIICRINDICM